MNKGSRKKVSSFLNGSAIKAKLQSEFFQQIKKNGQRSPPPPLNGTAIKKSNFFAACGLRLA